MNREKLKLHFNDQLIWVIGASDGIGEKLCQVLDQLGASLILSARNESKLSNLCSHLKNASYEVIDVVDYDSFSSKSHKILKNNSIDRVIYLPAYYEPMKLEQLNIEQVRKTIDTNLTAVFYMLEFVLPYIKEHPTTQLSVFASVAGYFGLPYSQPYASTKAGVISVMQSLKNEHSNLDIKLICPGFVQTKLTDKNKFTMPGIITTDEAANHILKGLTKKSFEIHFPKSFTLKLKFLNLLPYNLFFKILAKALD